MSIKILTNKVWRDSLALHVGDVTSTLFTPTDAKNLTGGARHLESRVDVADDTRTTYVNKEGTLSADTLYLANAKKYLGHRLAVFYSSTYNDNWSGNFDRITPGALEDFGRLSCAKFARANDERLQLLDAAAADFKFGDEDFSFAGFFYLDSVSSGNNYYLLSKYSSIGGDNRSYSLNANNTTLSFQAGSDGTGGAVVAVTSGTAAAVGWQFLACYHDSVNNLLGISINGGAFTTAAYSTGVFAAGVAEFMIGGGFGSGLTDGRAQFVGAYNKVLTLAEVNYLYNAGAGRLYSELNDAFKSVSEIISYWNMTDTTNFGLDSHGTNHLTDTNTVQTGTGVKTTMDALPIINSNFIAGGFEQQDCVYEFDQLTSQNAFAVLGGAGDGGNFTERLSKFFIGADFLDFEDIPDAIIESPIRRHSTKKIGREYFKVDRQLSFTLRHLTRAQADEVQKLDLQNEPIVLFDRSGKQIRDKIYHCVIDNYSITPDFNDLYSVNINALRLDHV